MRTAPKALIASVAMLLMGLSAAPAQARFFVGLGFGPGIYRPYPVFYRPYLPPPPVFVAPRPAFYVAPRPIVVERRYVVERPVVYHSVSYRYSRPVIRHYAHVYHRRVVAHRSCR